jgi:thiol:disulfide interchange protein
MIEPNFATIVILGVGLLLIVIIPLLDGSERFSKFISLRYTLVAVCLLMALGCILDFSHLSDKSRNIILLGSLILVGLFVAVRSLEKMKIGNKVIELSAQHGNTKVNAKLQNKKDSQIVEHETNIVEDTPDVSKDMPEIEVVDDDDDDSKGGDH